MRHATFRLSDKSPFCALAARSGTFASHLKIIQISKVIQQVRDKISRSGIMISENNKFDEIIRQLLIFNEKIEQNNEII